MKADMNRQWRLLDVAALDTRLAQLTHKRARSAEQAALDAATRELALATDEVVRARTALDDVEREVRRAEDSVAQVRERMARNTQRLESGSASAKDLQALQHEIDSLVRRQGTLEDEQMEVMERAESLQGELDVVEARRTELAGRVQDAQSARDVLFEQVDRERADVERQRADAVAGVGDDLLALYAKVSEQVGGVGAAALVARRCSGCNLELGPLELTRIRAAADDEVLRHDECRRILVRTGESGL